MQLSGHLISPLLFNSFHIVDVIMINFECCNQLIEYSKATTFVKTYDNTRMDYWDLELIFKRYDLQKQFYLVHFIS